jgi:hypothetical protein
LPGMLTVGLPWRLYIVRFCRSQPGSSQGHLDDQKGCCCTAQTATSMPHCFSCQALLSPKPKISLTRAATLYLGELGGMYPVARVTTTVSLDDHLQGKVASIRAQNRHPPKCETSPERAPAWWRPVCSTIHGSSFQTTIPKYHVVLSLSASNP